MVGSRIKGLKKRSVTIAGHRTSVSLEPLFWTSLKELADEEGVSMNALITRIDSTRETNLSSALRLYVLEHYRSITGR